MTFFKENIIFIFMISFIFRLSKFIALRLPVFFYSDFSVKNFIHNMKINKQQVFSFVMIIISDLISSIVFCMGILGFLEIYKDSEAYANKLLVIIVVLCLIEIILKLIYKKFVEPVIKKN